MKNLFFFAFFLITTNSFAQSTKWFLSFSSGCVIGGPSASLKSQMKNQGYNQTATSTFFGNSTTRSYPYSEKAPSLKIIGGFKVSESKHMFFSAGYAATGEVLGFKGDGGYMNIIIASAPTGDKPRIRYDVLQFSAGYMYSLGKANAMVGVAPSVFLFSYKYDHFGEKNTAFTPGVTGMVRLPLGAQKRLIGVDFVADLNVALPVKMKEDNSTYKTSFQPGSVNMIHGSLGFAFSFRK